MYLARAGIDLELRNPAGFTALIYAVAGGHLEATRTLVQFGADVNARDETGGSVLMAAVAGRCQPPVLNLLLNAGADVNVADVFGETALLLAAVKGPVGRCASPENDASDAASRARRHSAR